MCGGQADVLRDSDLDAAISQSLDEAGASPQKATAKNFLDSIKNQDSHVGHLEIEKQVLLPLATCLLDTLHTYMYLCYTHTSTCATYIHLHWMYSAVGTSVDT